MPMAWDISPRRARSARAEFATVSAAPALVKFSQSRNTTAARGACWPLLTTEERG